MVALRVSFGFSFESMKSMTTFRPARPPSLFTTFAQAFMASTDALNTPGASELSTSAITATWISVAVMPTSSALGFELWAPADTVPTVARPTTAMTTASVADRTRERRKVPPGLCCQTVPSRERSVQFIKNRR